MANVTLNLKSSCPPHECGKSFVHTLLDIPSLPIAHTKEMSNPTPNAQAGSSKRNGQASRPRNGGKGKGKGSAAQPKLKSNQAKRLQADEELKELQTRIDNFVCTAPTSIKNLLGGLLLELTAAQVPSSSIETFSQLPLSRRTLKGR